MEEVDRVLSLTEGVNEAVDIVCDDKDCTIQYAEHQVKCREEPCHEVVVECPNVLPDAAVHIPGLK